MFLEKRKRGNGRAFYEIHMENEMKTPERQQARKLILYWWSLIEDYKRFKKRCFTIKEKACWDAKIEELGFCIEITKTVFGLWDNGTGKIIPPE